MAALWQRLLHYITTVNYWKKYELHYSGFYSNLVLRSPTFECDINDLERDTLANLLCGFQSLAASLGVSLDSQVFEDIEKQYGYPVHETLSHHIVDKHLYKSLHNLAQDFLVYANEFFECMQLN